MASTRFLNNNPGYLQQGQRPDYYNARGGPGSIDAHIYPEGRHLMGGGIDALKLVNSPYGRQRGIGYRQAEEGVAGMRRDLSDPNRPLFDLNQGGVNPYGNGTVMANQGGNQAPQQAPQGPNEDQQRWAQKFADEQRQPMAPQTPNQTGGNSLFGAVGLNPATGMGKNPSSFQGYSAPQAGSAPSAPTNFSRSALIQGAQKSGEFDKIRDDYNAKAAAAGTGMQMDKNGNINPMSKLASGPDGTSEYARNTLGAGAEDIRARRNFERGESLDGSVSKGVGALTKINPYGSASATFGGPSTGVRQGMMPDPLTGKMVPMRQWAADQSAVQATKYGPDAAKAGEDYFNKGAIAKDIASKMPTAAIVKANPYSKLSPAMTGESGTIKTPPAEFAPKTTPEGMPTAESVANKPLDSESGQRLKDAVSGKTPIELNKPAIITKPSASSNNLQKVNPYGEPRTQNNTKLAPFFIKKHQREIDDANASLKYVQGQIDELQSPSGQVGKLKFGDPGYTKYAQTNLNHYLKRLEKIQKEKSAAEQKLADTTRRASK